MEGCWVRASTLLEARGLGGLLSLRDSCRGHSGHDGTLIDFASRFPPRHIEAWRGGSSKPIIFDRFRLYGYMGCLPEVMGFLTH